MKVLIACEESGRTRDAFRARGHDAYSCDLLPGRGVFVDCHIVGDAATVIGSTSWDLVIAHPPCTEFSGSGARWRTDHWVYTKSGRRWHDGGPKRDLQRESIGFVLQLWASGPARMAIENPVGELSSLFGPATQYIHPWQFGHPEFKKTGLWLRGLPQLKPTHTLVPPDRSDMALHNAWSVVHRAAPGPDRARLRSETYSGWANAMADQWGKL